LKRRDFLKNGTVALAAPIVLQTISVASEGRPVEERPLASADVIWSATSIPVPLLTGGGSDALASPAEKIPTPDLHSVFAKDFRVDAAPCKGVLHLFAFTRYRLYVNGTYVGRGPCRYQNQRPEYDTRDISRHLQPGRNVVVVLAHRDGPTGRIMQHAPGFVAALEITQAGRTRVIRTDATWVSMPDRSFQARAQAWSSIEEHVDARKTSSGNFLDLSDGEWQPSIVAPESGTLLFHPRSSALQTEVPLAWIEGSATFPLDLEIHGPLSLHLKQLAQAFHVIEMDADAGSELEVRYCLPHGEESGRCTYIARPGVQTYIGGDTFAFSRLELRLNAGRMTLKHVTAHEVRYPFQRVASFECSDPILTQLWKICARSLEVLSEDSYVDCADRERVEWTDDSPPAFDCTRVMMRGPDEGSKTHWADSRLLRGLLRRIALTQQADGQLKAHSCSERFDIHAIMEDRSCDWVVLLREYYESSGDTELVRELWPTLLHLMSWYRQRRTTRGLTLAREWEVWDNPLRYEFCEGAGLNAMVYRALVDAAYLAKGTGRRRDAEAFAQEAERLRADFNALLWSEREGAYLGALFGPGSETRPQSGHPFTGQIDDGRFRPTAQANLFALYAGIVPEDRVSSVRNWILAQKSQILEPMSYYYLFRMLYAMNDEQSELAVISLMKDAWKNQVDSEWQTSWEELEKGGGSKVHIYGIHPGYFLTAFVLGARREGPVGARTIVIEPRLSGLGWARGVCVTEFGPVEVDWKAQAVNATEIRCVIPEGIATNLRLHERNGKPTVTVDGTVCRPHLAGSWLELQLSAGVHTILLQN
jgi:alpha-L-rhamnosidase